MNADTLAVELRSLSARLQSIAGLIDEAAPLIESKGNCRESQAAMRALHDELRESLQIAKGVRGMLFMARRK